MNSINTGPTTDIFFLSMASASVLSFYFSSALTNNSSLPFIVVAIATDPCFAVVAPLSNA
jgi:hypothetical protein